MASSLFNFLIYFLMLGIIWLRREKWSIWREERRKRAKKTNEENEGNGEMCLGENLLCQLGWFWGRTQILGDCEWHNPENSDAERQKKKFQMYICNSEIQTPRWGTKIPFFPSKSAENQGSDPQKTPNLQHKWKKSWISIKSGLVGAEGGDGH